MKTMKSFLMAALALTFAACSSDDNEILTPEQPQQAEGITITATLAPKDGGAATRAVSEGTNKIVAEWAENEHIAILYEVSSTKYVADATITAVDGTTGEATISFTVESGTADNTACTLVYPLSAAKDDHSGVKDAATLLAAQDGTLNASLDVRVGEGTIQTSMSSLDVTTQPAAQFAIWKLTLGSAAKNLHVLADNSIAAATLATAGTEFTIAVPAVSSKTVTIVASDESKNCYYYSKANVSLVAGKYYQSTPTMTTIAGAIGGLFSVSASKKVFFSKGNLKYDGSAWSFFDNQYDYLKTHDGTNWDHFGWSTSSTTYGMSTSTSYGDYSGDFVDWGATMGDGWSTLSSAEWKYLFNTRSASTVNSTANARYAKAKVNNVQGVILFPDTYTHPDGVTAPTNVNTTNTDFTANTYDATAWEKMEAAGCVFLPAAGDRYGSSRRNVGTTVNYWSGTVRSDKPANAYYVYFSSNYGDTGNNGNRNYGFSVRLVRPVE